MRPIKSTINSNSSSYRDNYQQMSDLVKELNGYLQKSLFQGKEKHLAKARKANKLLARERIELLLDQDSFFLELLPLIGLQGKGFGPGGTAVCGIGLVTGRLCMINANVGSNRGGSIDKATLEKSIRMSEIASENGLPVINLVESSGANLPEQEQIFNYGGTIFREITRRSRKGFPTISVVFGNSTAGGAYIPGMSDYTIMVKKQAKVFLAGPPLVKMATNEITDDESLGGAEMHSSISGVSDYLAENETDAIRLAREVMHQLAAPLSVPPTNTTIEAPLYSAEELLGIVPADIKKPIDARELIARIVDGSRFSEFKPNYGPTLITGYALIHGYKIGIIANNGVILSEAANKATHFIQLCNRNNIPLLYLQNTTGFMVGRAYEEGGIIKDGAKMLNAVSNSDVPTITIMIGASYGAGNYAMNGRAYQPRFLFSYPNSKIAVMGPQQLSGVMEIIQRAAAHKSGIEYDEKQAAQLRQYMIQQVEQSSTAWYATSQGWDDGVIDPRETRNYLAVCLATIHNQPIEGSKDYGVFRM
ncbi:acyl-CoA carboxylase subunit beta [Aureispira anguillae]|uniref:Acyl-CoA carboxylase subunit beta n=1 Tax=Aureispira anguillae TaxID=2864201 RepID=A0A915YFW7_9BACT|nr:carboxyl transferase domain-containing protein [Aureispira anguillae]BDS12256.1 acyl-CoA carboxylase subunit beta [Aureispira anguillae]